MAEAAKKPTKKQKEAELVAETLSEEAKPEIIAEVEQVEKDESSESASGVGSSADEQAGAARGSGTAKAGKRSTKAQVEKAEKEAKEERKSEVASKEEPKAKPTPKARTRTERAGKKYREVAKLIEKDKVYSLGEALQLATKTSTTKFDATVELHVNLGVDPRQADQNVRDTVSLPAGTGKEVRIATLASDEDAEKLFAKLEKEDIDFDVLIATPNMMPKLGKYARLLGPRGLMPNPKSGTVTPDVATAVEEAKAGRVEYRVDQAGIVHLGIGKVSFGAEKLTQNAEAVMASIRAARPSSLKANYIKTITISTTMGPGIKVETGGR